MGDSSPLAHSPTLAATAPREETSATFAAGAQVGEYVVDRFLGAGATGEVYAGHHPVIGKRVAIKVLRHELAASAEAAERFIREARAVNQVEHDNVVDVFAFGRLDDGRLYLVMDLVDGNSLRAALVNGPLELPNALAILDAIADALDAAHARGVVHRDLKPDNIMLSSTTPPRVFVLDFGIAKLISTANAGEASGPGTLTGQGTWLGTPGYMAPEQWSVDGAAPASDRYALGVIAFELLSGSLPFSAPSVPGMMEQHFRADVPALAARGAVGTPASVDAVLRKALAKEPSARYPTARAFVGALRTAAGRGARASAAVHRKLLVPALAGAGVLALAVVVMIVKGHDSTIPSAAPAPHDDSPPPGTLSLAVDSSPSGATLVVDGTPHGTTPATLVGRQGEPHELVVTKPGYLPVTQKVTIENAGVQIALPVVTQFEGVWRLANGELRRFARNGDQVDVFKRGEAHGADTFFKSYDFVRADTGIAFAVDDEIVDARAPNDPRCHVKVHVEYRYNPAGDVLEQRRDKVTISFHDGSCTVQSREVEPTRLVRTEAVDEVVLPAPVGRPIAQTKPTRKTVSKQGKPMPADPKLSVKQAEVRKAQAAPQQNAAATSQAYTDVGPQANAPPSQAPQQQIVPQPQAAAPSLDAADTRQRQKK